MEMSLHRTLKAIYLAPGAKLEAPVHGYRADILDDSTVVEIQASPLGAIARKVGSLTSKINVLVVKPVVRRKLIVTLDGRRPAIKSRRYSPKRGRLLDVFWELVRFTNAFPHPRLAIELLLVDLEEHRRSDQRRGSAFQVVDRRLLRIVQTWKLRENADLVSLLPQPLPGQFTTASLARTIDVTVWLARAICYTLRRCGAVEIVGKKGNLLLYETRKQIVSQSVAD